MGIVLIGYRGSGKTRVGRIVAEQRDEQFVDIDELIVHFAGRDIATIFSEEGEHGFRNRERKCIEMSTAVPNRVISAGGGAVESPDTRELLRNYGTVVWLSAPADVLWSRISSDPASVINRPNLAGGGLSEVVEILEKRTPLYAQTSHVTVDASRSPNDVARDINDLLAALE